MSDRLNPGDQLTSDQSLTSANSNFRLTMQDDGNLVLYNKDNAPLWSSKTDKSDVHRCIMQPDGNLVLYHVDKSPAWASNTNGNPGSYVVMQDDGNLVIYKPLTPIWATGTN
jgi:hypothetical protein